MFELDLRLTSAFLSCKIRAMIKSARYCFYILSYVLISQNVVGQTGTVTRSKYVSQLDAALFIKNIAVIKAEDNVQGVYAQGVAPFLQSAIDNDSYWGLSVKKLDKSLQDQIDAQSVDGFDINLTLNKKILANCDCQGFLIVKVTKSVNLTSLKLTLFSGTDGQPLVQEQYQEKDLFQTEMVHDRFLKMYENLKNKLPFGGYVLSRRGDELTLNVGRDKEIEVGQKLTAVQILNLKRHPKYSFMTEAIKEVLGHLVVVKVEDHLSFVNVQYEKEPGLIEIGAKVIIEKPVSLPAANLSESAKQDRKKFNSIEEKDLAYGKDPKEWTPPPQPQFGKVFVGFRLGDYTQDTQLVSGQTIDARSSLVPGVKLGVEMWFTDKIIGLFNTTQTVFSVSNRLEGSSPSKISMSMSQYLLGFGYNFFMEDDFFGPKITLYGGYDMRSYKAASTEPTALTTMNYSGVFLGLTGAFDLPLEKRTQLGADVKLYLFPSLSESPTSSGDSKNTLTSFSFLVMHNWKANYNIKGELAFDYSSTNFRNGGTRANPADSTTHKETSLTVGLEYLF